MCSRVDQSDMEYETVQIWSEGWQCHVCGPAVCERDVSWSRSRRRRRRTTVQRKRCHQTSPRKEARRPGGRCWTCGGPTSKESSHMRVSRKRKLTHLQCVAILESRTFFLGPSAASRGFQIPRARAEANATLKAKTPEPKCRFFWNRLLGNCKIRGAVHRLAVLSSGIQKLISTACCRCAG